MAPSDPWALFGRDQGIANQPETYEPTQSALRLVDMNLLGYPSVMWKTAEVGGRRKA